MNTVTQVYRHPVAIYYNRDGSLAFIRFMCFKCVFDRDRLRKYIDWNKLCCFLNLEELPLVTLPEVTDASLFSYIDVPAEKLFKEYLLDEEGTALRGVSCISRLYTDGELISQAFQVLGCYEKVFDTTGSRLVLNYMFRSEYAHPGEPRILIFDHTLNRRYILLNALMRLKGRINVGNMNLETGFKLSMGYTCPLPFIDTITVTKAIDALGVLGTSLQKKTNTEAIELRIDSDYIGDSLVVPESVERLVVTQPNHINRLQTISCPSSMTLCSVWSLCLENFIAPKVCALFKLRLCDYEHTFPYTKQLFPEVLKPMGSEYKTSFLAAKISSISHNFMNYSYLHKIEVIDCSFTSDTDTVILPVASKITLYSGISFAEHIKTVRLVKHTSIPGSASVVNIIFAALCEPVDVIVDCDIKHLDIRIGDALWRRLTISGKGKIKEGTVDGRWTKVEIPDPHRHNLTVVW